MTGSQLLQQLIDALCCMPGIGKKSAQRIAYQLLQRNRAGAMQLSKSLAEAVENIGHCQRCRTFSEAGLCGICDDPKRDQSLICVVENPPDVDAIEETDYKGLYFVLMGHLSPLDGVGASDLGLDLLQNRLRQHPVQEVILATNTTVEGETTAHFISEMVRTQGLKATRIAQGVPMGGELEYVDSGTISHAFAGRREI